MVFNFDSVRETDRQTDRQTDILITVVRTPPGGGRSNRSVCRFFSQTWPEPVWNATITVYSIVHSGDVTKILHSGHTTV